MNIFEQATRQKIRFLTDKGLVSVEDLWELPLTSSRTNANLDDIAKELFKAQREGETPSFVNTNQTTLVNVLLSLKLDIVKHVISVRLEEQAAARQAAANREKKQQILELIARKENENLAGQSLDELRALANSL